MPDTRDWNRRHFLQTTALATLTLGVAAAPVAAEDRPTTHGMLAFGERTLFFSHLPMFDGENANKTEFVSPHRFQVILQMALTAEQAAAYAKDRQANPNAQFYTVAPERFILTRLFEPRTAPRLTQFTATIFRGHFEGTGRPVPGLEDVQLKIARVVHGRHFDPKTQRLAALEYLLFGRGTERFLAHAISLPPDFDHVVTVASITPNPTDQDLEKDVRVTFPDRKNEAARRLRPGDKVEGMLRVGSGTPSKVQIEVGKRIYFEESELLMPPEPGPTPEEKKD